jgi:TPR repeat protein
VAAQNELGLLFEYMYRSDRPFLTSRHVSKAIKWFTLAANKGHAEARFNLGHMYSEGRTVKQDLKITFYWWTLAAEQGHAKAQNHLGGMYENGHGVPMNGEIAVKWYTSSAKLGLNIAQFNLAWSFQYGLGGVKNYKNAYAWYMFAASNFHPDGYEKLVQLKKEMTTDEISNAEIELELEKVRGTLYGKNKLLGFD